MGHLATERPFLLRDSLIIATLIIECGSFTRPVLVTERKKLLCTIVKQKKESLSLRELELAQKFR